MWQLTRILLVISVFTMNSAAFARNDRDRHSSVPHASDAGLTEVELFLKNDLGIEELSEYALLHEFKARAAEINPQEIEKTILDLGQRAFSTTSAKTIGQIFRALGRTEYSNAIVLGEAGVGKSFLIQQLVALYSLGILPEFLKPEVGDGKSFQILREAFLGKTDIYLVNLDLLSKDHTKPGQPWATEEVRMRTNITALFNAAKREFKKKDSAGNGIGRRSIFIIDEAATLPDLVQVTLKKILDQTGFKNPNDPILSTKDSGFNVIALTTPNEYREMVKGDSAVERRYSKVLIQEVSEAEALQIVKNKSVEWSDLYGLKIEDEAIKTIIRMRRLLQSPPLAMPDSVLKATNDLFLWRDKTHAASTGQISAQDARVYLIESLGLTESWFEGPNGEPPFFDLAEKVKKRLVMHDEPELNHTDDSIIFRIQTWGRLGFGRDVPVFFVGGPTASGKDTLFEAINYVLFGNSGKHLMFSLATTEGFGINAIIEGPPLGNHSDGSHPLLVQQLESGRGRGMIAFNEGKDAASEELEKLKVFIEAGEITPRGRDSRVRPLHFPIFVMGQWGEEAFQNEDGSLKSDEEIKEIVAKMTQAQIEAYFLDGGKPGKGKVSRALLDRAKSTGGVYIKTPVAKKDLPRIVEMKKQIIVENLQLGSNIVLKLDANVLELIAKQVEMAGEGPRGLKATAVDFTEGALNEAINQGMPMRDQQVTIKVDEKSKGQFLVVTNQEGKKWKVAVSKIRRIKLLGGCSDLLKGKE